LNEHNRETIARIEELESRFAYQEEMLDELNDIIIRQQSQIDQLEVLGRHLLEKLRELSTSENDPPDDGSDLLQQKPPHY